MFTLPQNSLTQLISATSRSFADAPKLLGIEWLDSSTPTVYVTGARDAILSAILDSTQGAMGAPLAVLAQPTCPGDVIQTPGHSCHAARAVADPEVSKLCFEVRSAGPGRFVVHVSSAR